MINIHRYADTHTMTILRVATFIMVTSKKNTIRLMVIYLTYCGLFETTLMSIKEFVNIALSCKSVRQSRPARILYKSIAGRYRPVSYTDVPITARYRFIKNASWAIPVADNILY